MIILILIGVYGYGALTTSSGNRATTLARFDGLELVARVSGTLLSPVLANKIGRYANFILKLICDLLAILYLIFIIKDTERLDKTQSDKEVTKVDFKGKKLIFLNHGLKKNKLNQLVVKPFLDILLYPMLDMFKSIFKIRPNGLHILIAIQFYMFATYWFVLEEKALKYLYLRQEIENFTGTDYSWFFAFSTSVNAVGLLLIVPILSKIFHFHDSMLLTICLSTETAGNL